MKTKIEKQGADEEIAVECDFALGRLVTPFHHGALA